MDSASFSGVLGRNTLLSQSSIPSGIQMGSGEFDAGGSPAMDYSPIQIIQEEREGRDTPSRFVPLKTEISEGLMGL